MHFQWRFISFLRTHFWKYPSSSGLWKLSAAISGLMYLPDYLSWLLCQTFIKVDDGQFYEAHYTCCTFNTRRQNTRKGIMQIQIVLCYKTNFTEDWSSY
jgi:hypothetical protein